jgi:Flp pilus assembly protein TadG
VRRAQLAARPGARPGARRGVSGLEFALVAGIMGYLLINAFDVGIYLYKAMQVANAAEMGAQAAWEACDPSELPATTQCADLNAAVQAAVASTTLGNAVSLAAGYPSEGYYCMNAGNALQYVADVNHKPADCTAAGMPTLKPGDYIEVRVSYGYASMFPISAAAGFATPIVRTAMMRLL